VVLEDHKPPAASSLERERGGKHGRRSSIAAFAGAVVVLLTGGVFASPSVTGAETQLGVRAITQATTSTAGTYVALPPARITDTRTDSGYPNAGKTLGPDGTLNMQVTGTGGVPASGVSAVVMNVTAVSPTASSFLTVYPEGTTQPLVANLVLSAGADLANLVTVPVGSQGDVTILNHAGSTDVVVDVEGYYTSSPQATGLYNPVNPTRVFGTLQVGGAIGAGTSAAVTVTGNSLGVPADASAVVANVTASESSGPSYLSVYPAPATGTPAPPTAANVIFRKGQVIGNRVIVPVGADGQIEVYNHTGSVNVDVDLYGYYTGSAGELGAAFTPITPTRFTDTRIGTNGTSISPGSSQNFNFLSDDIPSSAVALASNVTVLAGSASGYLTVYPTTDSTPPVVGDVVFASNAVAQDFAIAPLNGAGTEIFNSSADRVNIVIDAFGYFAPPPPAVNVVADPSSVPADGLSTSVLTVTVTTGSGVAYDDPVSLTLTPSVAGSCGVASATGSTNASGQVTSNYTASSTPGSCTVTATEANGGTTGSTVITQTSG
jgi:serine protease